MWSYVNMLEFPVKVKNCDARAAQIIISQYGGPDGEAGAAMRYLSQKFGMSNDRVAGALNDIGTVVTEFEKVIRNGRVSHTYCVKVMLNL